MSPLETLGTNVRAHIIDVRPDKLSLGRDCLGELLDVAQDTQDTHQCVRDEHSHDSDRYRGDHKEYIHLQEVIHTVAYRIHDCGVLSYAPRELLHLDALEGSTLLLHLVGEAPRCSIHFRPALIARREDLRATLDRTCPALALYTVLRHIGLVYRPGLFCSRLIHFFLHMVHKGQDGNPAHDGAEDKHAGKYQ